jgi:hypothetical protein
MKSSGNRMYRDSLSKLFDSHWKDIFPRDTDIRNTLTLYFGGFWKRFEKEGGVEMRDSVVGITHPFELQIFEKNKAADKELEGFGKVILLEYTEPIYNQFYDVLKIVDENTILDKASFGKPRSGRELLTFSMSRKYPFEFMTEEDHEILYDKMTKPSLSAMEGIWEGQLVSDSTWTNPIFRFRYYFDARKKVLKNDYLFGGVLAGTAMVLEKEDHLEMQDVTGVFHDEIRQINENVIIGKYYSQTQHALRWLPQDGLSFIHIDV